jgi:hypothetical protein
MGGWVGGAAYTCWETVTNARETNYGTRIDYILASRALLADSGAAGGNAVHVTDCRLLPDVRGSDHCPVVADWDGPRMPASPPPPPCHHGRPPLMKRKGWGVQGPRHCRHLARSHHRCVHGTCPSFKASSRR